MSVFSTASKIFKRFLISLSLIFLTVGVLAFIFLGDSEKEQKTVQMSSSSNALPRESTDLQNETKLINSEEAKIAGDNIRASLIQSIAESKLVLKDASLCLVVGEWALYKADDSAYGLTKANLEIADALAKKGQNWSETFVSNVGEGSYVHQAYLEKKSEHIQKCENSTGFHSCWKECLSAFK